MAGTPTRIVLIRHAEPDEAVRGRCYGRLDIGLSPRGSHEHAGRLGRQLAAGRIAAVYSSPLRRAIATATADRRGARADPVAAAELAEIDCGELEGATWEEIERRYPGFFFWSSVPAGFEFPGGESYADLAARASRALEDIRARHPGRPFSQSRTPECCARCLPACSRCRKRRCSGSASATAGSAS